MGCIQSLQLKKLNSMQHDRARLCSLAVISCLAVRAFVKLSASRRLVSRHHLGTTTLHVFKR
jgi:hypothetical protein